ncbi:hypothetical protein D3C71_1612950 [compost metagenome]
MNALRQRIRRIAVFHGNGALRDNRTSIHASIDKMHRHARQLHAVFQRLSDRILAGKGRKQRRVDVDNPACVRLQHHRGD